MHTTDAMRFNRADYSQLPEGFPAFLLNGDLVRDAAPSWSHQALVVELILRLSAVAPGRVLTSPVDVVIDEWNVLQPDVLVLRRVVRGADGETGEEVPALVVEVLSPSTAARDRGPKTAAYVRAGVAEVWHVDPERRRIDVVTADGTRRYATDEVVESAALPGFRLAFADLDAPAP